MGKAIDCFVKFKDQVAIGEDEGGEVKFINGTLWKLLFGDTHVFRAFHGGAEVEIFDVDSHPVGVRSRDNGVKENLDKLHASCAGADVEGVVDSVATSCAADTALYGVVGEEFFFDFRVVIGDVAAAIRGNVGGVDGACCFGGSDKADEFIDFCIDPFSGVGSCFGGFKC